MILLQTLGSRHLATSMGRNWIFLASMVMIRLDGFIGPSNILVCITLLMSIKSHSHPFIWNMKPFNGSVGTSRLMSSQTGQNLGQLLLQRFGPSAFDDFTGALTKLRQTGTVQEYQTEFEKLTNHTEGLYNAFYRSCFISGMKDTI